MPPWVFCDRCRGMEVGWNRRYVRHSLTCVGGVSMAARLFAFAVATALVISVFPTSTVLPVVSDGSGREVLPLMEVVDEPEVPVYDPAVAAIEELIGRHARVSPEQRSRIARSVVESARRHAVDPFLVTGVLIAESSGNPYAISHQDAVGIMQIHVPTWGPTAEAEGINLFLLEDNIDLGTRILGDYTRRYGLWDGVMRYLGTTEADAGAMAYVRRVQGVYNERQAD